MDISVKPKLSAYIFITAGVLWLLSLALLSTGHLALWVAAKVFYGVGVFFFVINK
jgi:hypothetical protein